jgi:hypothetical protein
MLFQKHAVHIKVDIYIFINHDMNMQKVLDIFLRQRDRRGRDRIVVGFTTTYAISIYHH